ncbi:MAG: helix-turn-helix domain-containing protein [Pseudobutyrivibrio sp.]|nr:helix-turn-helix domain-containing protein [Pseudobutyrivibrio sp.]
MRRYWIFAQALKEFRLVTGKTQEQIAAELGRGDKEKAISTISRWENGVFFPSGKSCVRLYQYFERHGYTWPELFQEKDFEYNNKKRDILVALRDEKLVSIGQHLDSFVEMLEEDDSEKKEFVVLSEHIIKWSKREIAPQDFILAVKEIINVNVREVPLDRIRMLKMRQIEYLALFKIAEAKMEMKDYIVAKEIYKGIFLGLKNRLAKNLFFKELIILCALRLVRIYINLGEMDEAKACLTYVFEAGANGQYVNVFIQGVTLLQELSQGLGDDVLSKAILDFLVSGSKIFDLLRERGLAL